MEISAGYRYIEFALDSYDAISSLGGDKTAKTDWPLFDLSRPLGDISYLKILEVQIPFTWYVFSNQNNTFQLLETSSQHTITIPVGNYAASNLATLLGTLLTSASQFANGYTVTYSATTQKFTFTTPGPQFSLVFAGSLITEGNNDPSIMLGANASQNSTIVGGNSVLVMPNAALVTGPNYLYLNSQKMGTLTNMYLPEGAENLGSLGPQIAKIPVNCQAGGVIFWQDPAPQHWFRVDLNQNLPQIDFYFSLGNWNNQVPLQFNGVSFSLKLGLLIDERSDSERLSGQIQDGFVVARQGPKRRRQ
jgi:hypothetical protein